MEPEKIYQEIGIRSFGRGTFQKECVAGVELGSKRVFSIKANDLLISNVFAWEGAIAIATEQDDGLIGSHRFMTWTPRSSDVSIDYLREYFLSDQGLADIRRASPGSAGRNKTLGIKAFEDINLPLPSLATQKAVAKRLAMSNITPNQHFVDSAAIARDRLLSNTGSRSQRLILRDFARPETTPTRVDATKQYQNVGLLNRGRGLFKKPSVNGSETKYTQLFQITKNQLIYSKLFGWEGAVSVVPADYDGYFVSAEFPHFDLNSEIVRPAFMRHITHSRAFQNQLSTATTGMGQRRQRVNVAQFLSVEVDLPSIEQQDRLIPQLDRIDHVLALDVRRRRLAAALPAATRNDIFSKFIC